MIRESNVATQIAIDSVFSQEADGEPSRLATPRAPRYYSLDIWRGAACLAVVAFHSIPNGLTTHGKGPSETVLKALSFGWLGVPVFFVISGICIAASGDSARRSNKHPLVFFRRRFRRIYPPFWICVLLSAVIVIGLDCILWPGLLLAGGEGIPHPWWLDAGQWFGNLTLTESWRHHIAGSERAYFLGHAWTLCYEEQFYFVIGILLLIAPRALFLGTLLVTIFVCGVASQTTNVGGFFFDGHWLLFAAGIAVYYRLNYASKYSALVFDGVLLVALIASFWDLVPVYSSVGDGRLKSIAAFGFALAMVLIHPWDAYTYSLTLLAPIRFCGSMCYSLYLIHPPVVMAIKGIWFHTGNQNGWATLLILIPSCVAASVAVAWPFYLVVERRFQNAIAQVHMHQSGACGSQRPSVAIRV